MALQDELLALEEGFWTGNADYYRDHVDDRCLTAFVEMAGIFGKDEIARTVGDGVRWQDVQLSPKGLVVPTDDFALVTYEASATRGNGVPYRALVSSGYVRRAGTWKLAFHQHTPLRSG
ncbi:MAG TPA: hypothetical protein VF339_12070 [Gammaproteobacteria bacterium]